MAESISARVAWKLKKAIVGRPAKGTSNTGTASFVRTDENGVGWVRLPGADTDTPINGNLVTDMKPGDTVSYRIDGGRLSVMGNATSPATSAGYVQSVVDPVEVKADTAISDAARAYVAAEDAEKSAEIANDAANQAIEDAAAADSAARSAAADAAAAQSSADAASTAATQAISDAAAAQTSANNAAASATQANTSANSALVQLSVIEDVAGTLDWISQHGSYVLTTDTSVVSGKVYFELVSGEYIPIASPDPSANPQQEGWYVLDITDSQTEYIMAHLAVTSAGLWVLPNGIGSGQTPATASGYKVLLSNTGMTVYDSTGADVAHYGTTSRIGSVSALHLLLRATGIVLMPANGESSQQSLKNISDFFVDQDVYLDDPLDQSSALLTGLVGKLNNLLSTPSGLIYSVGNDDVLIVTESGAQIGSSSSSHISMDYHSMRFTDLEGGQYFNVQDLRGNNSIHSAVVEDIIINPGAVSGPVSVSTGDEFALNTKPIIGDFALYCNQVEVSTNDYSVIYYTSSNPVTKVRFSRAMTFYYPVVAVYSSNSSDLKALTFGQRADYVDYNDTTGMYSVALGKELIASGKYAFAGGYESRSSGWASTATNWGTQAAGEASHAEGSTSIADGKASHAEGTGTIAAGWSAHSEGVSSKAMGSASHAQNLKTIAGYDSQTAIGKYNDNDPNNAFEVGNGTADNARSNAFAVDWNGNATASGNLTAGNFRDAAMTRDLGSSGTARACRIGNMLIMSGSLGGCSISDTFTWTHLAHLDSEDLGITSVTSMGALVDVNGGGPSYYGSTNGGGTARIVDGVLYADMQTNAAFSGKYVKFIVTAYVE